jgi:hypothetical protein
MTKYQAIEIANQQPIRDADAMTLTPRIECAAATPPTSLNDLEAKLTTAHAPQSILISASGRLMTTSHATPPAGDIHYRFEYVFEEDGIEIRAQVLADTPPASPIRFVLPVVSRPDELIERPSQQEVRIQKPKGRLTIATDAANAFEAIPVNRVFNLVPGFLCLPLTIPMIPGRSVSIKIRAA